MTRLPRIASRDAVRALERLGFAEARQSGSHLVLKRDTPPARAVVPIHAGRILKLGTLKAILDECGITIEEFLDAL